MKKWSLRILSAILTFTLGLGAVNIMAFRPAPVAKVQTVNPVANIQAQLPPPQVAEATQPTQETTPLTKKEVEEVMQPHPVPISPYEIKRLIDENNRAGLRQQSDDLDLTTIWEKLNIEFSDDVDGTYDNCNRSCKAEIQRVELDGTPGGEILFKLNYGTLWTLHLIFRRVAARNTSDSGWELLGYLPYVNGAPFIPPSHRVVTHGENHWLIIKYVSGHGSAYGSDAEDWYEVGEKGVLQILTYQSGLYLGFANPTIDNDTQVLKVEDRDGITALSLQASTTYGYYEMLGEKNYHLWTAKRIVTFIKGPGMRKFIFDQPHSELTEDAFNSTEDALASSKDILKYNYRELATLAARGNAKQKDWLRSYLDTCDESPEKQSLQTALGDKQP